MAENKCKCHCVTISADKNPVISVEAQPNTSASISVSTVERDYNPLRNKPKINGEVLIGDKTSDQLHLQDKLVGTQTEGQNIKTINGETVLGSGNIDATPAEYVKNAAVANQTLTITKKDNTTVSFTPTEENYTTAEKNKLAGIEAGAEANVQTDWNQIDSSKDDFLKNKPDIAGMIEVETNRAEAAESGLSSRISTIEGDYLKTADKTALEGEIAQEAEDREEADTALGSAISTHTSNTNNPHSVTKAQVGLGSVENKPLDTAVTEGSTNYVSSGAVKTYVDNNGGKIDEIKINGTSQAIVNKVVNLPAYPTIDSLGAATQAELNAEAVAREDADDDLQEQINNLKSKGRFLSVWNATTGKPTTEPTTELPYAYKSGDFYIVGVVGATNYRPTGSSYTGAASTVVETEAVKANDFYIYDNAVWTLVASTPKTYSFSEIAGSPYDNTNLSNALTGLQTNITAEATRAQAAEATKVDKVSTANRVYGTDANGDQTTYDKNSFGQVDDVKVDGTSVVTNKVANVDLATPIANAIAAHDDSEEAHPELRQLVEDEIENRELSDLALWNEVETKSTVAVSATGTATDSVKYIIVNGVEKKIGGDEPTEYTTKLQEDLYAYTPIGKITGASQTNPVKIADAGDPLKDVFNAILGTEVDVNPTINQSGTSLTKSAQTGTTSANGGEVGLTIAAQTGTVTFKVANTASCSYGLKTASYDTYSKTSVTNFVYPIKARPYGEHTYQLRIKYPVLNGCTLSVTAGTLVMDDTVNRYLYCNVNGSNEVKVSISIPATNSSTAAITRFGQLEADVDFDGASYNGEAVTNFWTYLKASYTASGMSHAAISGVKSTSYTVTAGTRYAYTATSAEATAPTSGTKQSAISTFASSGGDVTYAQNDYIYFYTTGTGKTVQVNVLGQWNSMTTTSMGKVTFTQSTGATFAYDCYRIGPFLEGSGTNKFRV